MAVVSAQQPLARAVGRDLRLDHLGPRDDEALGQPGALRLGDVAHRRKVADAAIVDPVPGLLGAQLRLPRVHPGSLEFGADPVPCQAGELDPAVGARVRRARNGHGVDRAGDRHQAGVGAHGEPPI